MERDRISIDHPREEGVNDARGTCADPVVCYKVAMIPVLMATGLGPLAGPQHTVTGPDHLAGVAPLAAASLLAGLAWIGLPP